MRKVKQLLHIPESKSLVALCKDGSIWLTENKKDWLQCPSIPAGESNVKLHLKPTENLNKEYVMQGTVDLGKFSRVSGGKWYFIQAPNSYLDAETLTAISNLLSSK